MDYLTAIVWVGFGGLVLTLIGGISLVVLRRREDWPKSATRKAMRVLVVMGLLSLGLTIFTPNVSRVTNISSGQSDDSK